MKTIDQPGALADLTRRLRAVQVDSPALWGRMSAHQMICHCADALRMASGALAVSPATSFFTRTVVKTIALYAPMQWPKGIQTRPEVDQRLGQGTKPKAFETDVAELAALLETVTNNQEFVPTHPIFGPMSQRDWLRWSYLHMDHHLRQFGV